jgi:hypothetical protein
MFWFTPFAPMLVQWAQSRICGMQSFILEETEYGENKEREDKSETRQMENEDD